MSTDASTAISSLDKAAWAATKASDRLAILKKIQLNLYENQDVIAATESAMKNEIMGEELYNSELGKLGTVVPFANQLAAAIDLYTALASDKKFKPKGQITKVTNSKDDLYDVPAGPTNIREKVLYGPRADRLRVKGEPTQKGPYDKDTKLVAVIGGGNFSSPYEIIKAAFFDGFVVVLKSHPLNKECDKVWFKILAPLVAAKALAFCLPDQGTELTADKRVDIIYFTGGAGTAKTIIESTKKPLICEAGGVNPVIIVPGDRRWTASELEHHAQQIMSMNKCNGGAVCARPQLVVTCSNWSQREEFLKHLEAAAKDTTFACGTYYPGSNERMEAFSKAYPNAKRLQPEDGAYKNADVLLVTGDKEDSYSSRNEAFCQVVTEVPLETKADAGDFLKYAINYCNNKVLGTLCAAIIIDETTRKNNEECLQQAVTDLQYGSVGINTLPANAFFSPYLVWGGHDDEDELVTGKGNFGNVYGLENIDKAIIDDAFVSPGQMKLTNKAAADATVSKNASYSTYHSWLSLFRLLFTALSGSFKGKDW